MREGLVTRVEGPQIWVLVEGQELPTVLRGRLKKEWVRATSLVVVGDLVRVDDAGAVCGIAPRRSELCRPGFRDKPHPIAANVDMLLIVQSARQPDYNRRLTERFMAMASRSGVEPLVIITKSDLATPDEVAEWLAPLGGEVPHALTSSVDGRGLEELRRRLAGKTAAMAGPSGVGKSSLLNALYPGFHARVGRVSDATTKGRHTTTSSRLYPLPGGGFLADTPGIRSLALFDDSEAVEDVFGDIQALAAQCRFRNCTHLREPACAVRAAVNRGEIAPDRLRSYLRLKQGR